MRRRIKRAGWANHPNSLIVPMAERLCINSSYSSPHAASFQEANMEMAITIHFAINVFSPPKLLFLPNPKFPPDGFVTETIFMVLIAAIFGGFTVRCLF